MQEEEIVPIIPEPEPGEQIEAPEPEPVPWQPPGMLSGLLPNPQCLLLTKRIAIGLVALISLIAFWSFSPQAEGLIGSAGIAPISETLEALGDQMESSIVPRSLRWPTVFWFKDTNWMLRGVIIGGITFSILLLTGIMFQRIDRLVWPSTLILLGLYMSLVNAAGDFMMFQWDILLIECLLVILFLYPVSGSRDLLQPGVTGIWMWRILTFKLMIGSGIVKLTSQDASWWNLSALDAHFQTQPLPTGLSWYMHHLPDWMLRLGALQMFTVELLLPLLIFLGRWPRMVAAAGIILLQVMIFATGNYTFFNFLTIALAFGLLDDRILTGQPIPGAARLRLRPMRVPAWLFGSVWIALSVFHVVAAFAPRNERIIEASIALSPISSWRVNNPYGLFRVMSQTRPELVIEGSEDGTNWKPYPFKYKPGPFDRKPRAIAPHQPRLDWQMWFVAQQWGQQVSQKQAPRIPIWMDGLKQGIFDKNETILALLGGNPFPGKPPSFLRIRCLEYEFTTPEERDQTGNWWKATPIGGSLAFRNEE